MVASWLLQRGAQPVEVRENGSSPLQAERSMAGFHPTVHSTTEQIDKSASYLNMVVYPPIPYPPSAYRTSYTIAV